MFLSYDNPVYNTILIFTIIILILYITKPNTIYDYDRKEFRQFGTTKGKTLMPIYIIAIVIAILLYIIFYYLSSNFLDKTKNKTNNINNINNTNIADNTNNQNLNNNSIYLQQQQINNLQNQLQQILQQQLNQQLIHNIMNSNQNVIPNVIPNVLPNKFNI
jgi:predicted PurR-regulated permease PerM